MRTKDKDKDCSDEWRPIPREVEIHRDSQYGFGFVAGSEKPVIVRFVKEGGPSEHKLQSGDQILKINGEDVMRSPRERVIDRVKSCKYSIHLTVCQPHSNNSIRKSAFLTAAKKAKLKSNPSKVRFAEEVVMNCSPLFSSTSYDELCVPLIPNLLKVFLENGQTKTFRYDVCTTIQDVLNSLNEKLSIKCGEYFGIVFENLKSTRRSRFTLLDPEDTLAKIAALPGAHNLRCLLRVMFAPTDVNDILQTDSNSFEYLYHQCCNDVVMERFSPQLKYEVALRLSALQLNEYAISNGMLNSSGRVDLKAIERECGLEAFVPFSLLDSMKRKELHKLLNHFLKVNQHLCASGQKSLTATQIKLNYLKIVCELPSYGSKMFYNNIKSSTIESGILVSPKYGISFIDSMRNCLPIILAKIEDIRSIRVTKDDELYCCVEVQLENLNNSISIHHSIESPLHILLEDREAEEFVLILRGYHKILNNYGDNTCSDLPIIWDISQKWLNECSSSFCSSHTTQNPEWNNGNDVALKQIGENISSLRFMQCDETDDIESYKNLQNSANFEQNSNENQNRESIDMPSLLSMEILESQAYDQNIKSDDILKRIDEMNKIIADAEHYLAKEMHEPLCGENGRLKCARNSLQLLSLVTAEQSPTESDDSDSFISNFESPLHCFECLTNSKQLSNPSPHSYASPSSRSGSIGSSLITSSDDTCASHSKHNTEYDCAPVISVMGNQYDTLSESSVTDNENITLNVLPTDIDNFIASMTIPPPPSVSPNATDADDDAEYLLPYIIPPPPSESPIITKTQEDAIAKFWKVNDDIKKICDNNNKSSQIFNNRDVCNSSSGESGYDSALSMSTFASPNDEWPVFSEAINPKLPLSTVIEVVSSEFDHFNQNAFFLVKVSLS